MTPFSITRFYNGDMENQRFLTSVSFNQNLSDSLYDASVPSKPPPNASQPQARIIPRFIRGNERCNIFGFHTAPPLVETIVNKGFYSDSSQPTAHRSHGVWPFATYRPLSPSVI